jgi:hypothetical protein
MQTVPTTTKNSKKLKKAAKKAAEKKKEPAMDPDFAFDDVEAQTTMWIPKDQLVDDVSVSVRRMNTTC